MSSPGKGPSKLAVLGQPTVEPERRDARENRERILAAARRLLAVERIENICMDRLAKEAGVGKGTLYRRFEDRASLVRALLDEDAAKLQQSVLDGFNLSPTTPWLVRLERLLDALLDFAIEHRGLLSEALACGPAGPRQFDHPAHAWQRDTVALYLKKAIQVGEIDRIDTLVTAELILGGLDADRVRWFLEHGYDAKSLRKALRAFQRRCIGGHSFRARR